MYIYYIYIYGNTFACKEIILSLLILTRQLGLYSVGCMLVRCCYWVGTGFGIRWTHWTPYECTATAAMG